MSRKQGYQSTGVNKQVGLDKGGDKKVGGWSQWSEALKFWLTQVQSENNKGIFELGFQYPYFSMILSLDILIFFQTLVVYVCACM